MFSASRLPRCSATLALALAFASAGVMAQSTEVVATQTDPATLANANAPLRTMSWVQGNRLRLGFGLQEQPSRALRPATLTQAPAMWGGVGVNVGQHANVSVQLPVQQAPARTWRDSVQKGELHVGWKLKPAKSNASSFKELLSAKLDAQTTVVLKPRKSRVSVVLTSSW